MPRDLQDLFGSTGMEEEAIPVTPRQVAGPQPTAAEDGRALLGLAVVARCDVVALGDEIPHFSVGDFPARVVDDLELDTWDRDPDRALLFVGALGREIAEPGGRLGLAVHHEEHRRSERAADPADRVR